LSILQPQTERSTSVNYYVSEEVPSAWDHILSAFITVAKYDIEFNKGVPIEDLRFEVKHGLLLITYKGGSKITDAFAAFAKEISSATCSECALPSTRKIFESPKCDNCY
jgi:hypothetical protein